MLVIYLVENVEMDYGNLENSNERKLAREEHTGRENFFAKIYASKIFREKFRCTKLFDAKSSPPKDGETTKEITKEKERERECSGDQSLRKPIYGITALALLVL